MGLCSVQWFGAKVLFAEDKNLVKSSQEEFEITDRIGGRFVNFAVGGEFIKLPGISVGDNAEDVKGDLR